VSAAATRGRIRADRAAASDDHRRGGTALSPGAAEEGETVGTPTFGIFDHIEDIPGTPTQTLLRDRLDLVRMADEGGIAGYYLAEHHGGDLCMAPNQNLMIAAASQVTTRIRLGPMVKLLPLHHPVGVIEDLCTADQLTGGRYDFGVGRGVAPIEHHWYSSDWRTSTDRFTDIVGIICDALRTGEISSEHSRYFNFPAMPLPMRPVQDPVPFWYPGRPATAGRHGMTLLWPGVIDRPAHDAYVEQWHTHRGERARADGPDSRPRVACVLVIALSKDEKQARAVLRRGMEGLGRRTHAVHRFDHTVLPKEECDAAIASLHHILAHYEDAVDRWSGTPVQLIERLAAVLESGLSDYLIFQLPCGDMTIDEARRTLELFITEVKPELEKLTVAT
jgi:alkanesulfonate monooxygenase SsuD/methylene tetrahydromethanopterin reductase-like flavin-dependent oxidoreductase (luciferase family)